MSQNRPAVVLVTGGYTSAAAVVWAKNRGFSPITALNVKLGSHEAPDMKQAEGIAKKLGVEFVHKHITGISVVKSDDQPTNPAVVVPGHTSLVLDVAANYAAANGITDIIVGFRGITADTSDAIRDRTQANLRRMNEAAGVVPEDNNIFIHAPFMGILHVDDVAAEIRGYEGADQLSTLLKKEEKAEQQNALPTEPQKEEASLAKTAKK